ncbi:MAG: choice-of-anchor B family protein [Planctomycetota bacterium]
MKITHSSFVRTLRWTSPLLLVGAAGLLSTSADAHDSWRKLVDALPAVEAPMWSLSMQDGGPGGPDDPTDSFSASNVTLLSWIPLSAFPGGHGAGNDCWGYTSPSGREYAIMGLQRGFGFVEITDPTNPKIVGSIAGPSSQWHDIKVMGEYAYGVSEGGAGIQVIDLRNIDAGEVTLVRNKTQLGHETTHNIVANPDSGYLYLVGANVANGGLIAVSLDDPEDPTIVGSWSTHYVHDAQVVTYTDGPYAGREIAFCSNGFDGLEIIDVTDKGNMFRVGRTSYADLRYTHQAWLSNDKQLLYLNDELDEGDTVSVTTTRVFDVSDITDPRLVSTFTSGRRAVDHNNYLAGDYLYQANYRSGLRVFDVGSDPLNPTEVAYFDTFPGSDSPSFNGAWSTYPFFDSGVVIVSDIERGLFILDVGTDGAASLEIEPIGGAPTTLAPFGETVRVSINELAGQVDDDRVRMHLSVPGEPDPVVVPMFAQGGGEFEATLPGLPCLENVDYWFEAEATDGRLFRAPLSAPFIAYKAQVVGETDVIFADNFETSTGWSVQNVDLDDGAWSRGLPGGSGDRGDPVSDFDGSGRAYLTGPDGGNTDVDGGPTILTSPVYDVSDLGDEAYVRFAKWFTNDDADQDSLLVEVSGDGGSTWTEVEEFSGGPNEWALHAYRIADFVPATTTFRIRFSVADNPNDSVTEAGIDAFEILTIDCSSCPADFDGDGSLTIFDFLAFQTAFDTSDPRADFDGDGSFTIFDFLAFQTAFDGGCD